MHAIAGYGSLDLQAARRARHQGAYHLNRLSCRERFCRKVTLLFKALKSDAYGLDMCLAGIGDLKRYLVPFRSHEPLRQLERQVWFPVSKSTVD